MLLPFAPLLETSRFDPEVSRFADAHYSRETIGAAQCAPPGELILLRSPLGDVAFGWVRQRYRKDSFAFWANCFLFRNESPRRGSEIILAAEVFAVARWGAIQAFTYVDPAKIRSSNPGCCFQKAGWSHFATMLASRKMIFAKMLR